MLTWFLQEGANTKCEPLAPIEGEKPKSKEEHAFDRIKAVAIPTLKPMGDCRMLEMNRRTMIKRLLRSPGGLT